MEDKKEIMTCVCPHCQETIRIKSPDKSGKYKYLCTKCRKPFAVSFDCGKQDEAQEEPDIHVTRKLEDRDRYRTIGGLVEKRGGFFGKKKVWPLAEGRQTIGRKSANRLSDIMFDDLCMSRQSVELNVERHQDPIGQCFVYVLTVKRQKNPVLHNNEPLADGEEIILHIGDTITLGQTTLTLQ